MKRASSPLVRIAALMLPPTVAGALVLAVSGAGGASLGCGKCSAHIVAAEVSPPEPCITLTPSVCNLGGEGLRIENACTEVLSLSSNDFLKEGTLGSEGGTAVSSFVMQSDSFVELLAGPNATGQNVLTLYGTLGGSPITITIGVVEDSADGAASATGTDTGVPVRDAGHDARDASDASRDAPKDTGKDAKDAAHDARTDAKDASHDAAKGADAPSDGGSDANETESGSVSDASGEASG